MRQPARSLVAMLAVVTALALGGCRAQEPSKPAPVEGPQAEVPEVALPDVIALPNGFGPEGITGRDNDILVGSIPTGAIYRADVTTGEGAIVVPAQKGRAAIGIKIDDRDRIWVCGGPSGKAFVYDAATGAELAEYTLSTAEVTFINDVTLAGDAAWFTDSRSAVLHKVTIPTGDLAGQDAVSALKLTGDFELQPGADVFNLNGIAWTGERLICAQSETGMLFAVDPATGASTRIDLGAETLPGVDGLLLEDKTLFAVQNQSNQVAVVDLSEDSVSGTVRTRLTNPEFDVPTTIAAVGESLYLPNARFGTEATPETTYSVVRVNKP